MAEYGDPLLVTTGRVLDELVPPDTSLCLAYSGGMDSTVLLQLLHSLRPGRFRAVHVNHCLQSDADAWEAHCMAQCASRGIDSEVVRITVPGAAGESPEAVARDLRYAALATCLSDGEWLVTAQHQRDQLETVLLALLRGSGVHGLAGMPALAHRDDMTLVRPLLDVSHEELKSFADRHELAWIEDPSNADERFDRNYLRRRVVPLLQERWPAAAAAATRSARHAAAAMRALDEQAAQDLEGRTDENCAVIEPFRKYGTERGLNALRYWCRRLGLPVPSEAQGLQALNDLLQSRDDGSPLAAWPGTRIRRYRDQLFAFAESADPGASDAGTPCNWSDAGQNPMELGGVRGTVRMVHREGGGLDPAVLADGLEIRFRDGGERLRVAPAASNRELKKLLQEEGVLPWMRSNIPLFYRNNQLVAAGDLWLNFDHPDVLERGGMVPEWRGHGRLRSPF